MRPDYKKVNEAARALHAKYRLDSPPFDPESIAEAEGFRVIYDDFAPEVSPHLSGYSDANTNRIVVNRAISPSRKIYTIAHELAHLLLHTDYVKDDGRYQILPRKNFYSEEKPIEEKEADAFAAEFLVPLRVLRQYKDAASDFELARMFAVSGEVIANRSKWL
jgi:Zn-dependent peptidase ImmA (M78 family)